MFVEGKGMVVPSAFKVVMNDHEVGAVVQIAESRASYRSYKRGSDAWSRGLKDAVFMEGVGRISQEVRPIVAGCLGEWALCRIINDHLGHAEVSLDSQLRKWGDGGVDLSVRGLQMQVKTRQRDYGTTLIRVRNGGLAYHLTQSAFVSCEWIVGQWTVSVIGWFWGRILEGRDIVPSRVGNHQNVEVADRELNGIQRLLCEIDSRSVAAC